MDYESLSQISFPIAAVLFTIFVAVPIFFKLRSMYRSYRADQKEEIKKQIKQQALLEDIHEDVKKLGQVVEDNHKEINEKVDRNHEETKEEMKAQKRSILKLFGMQGMTVEEMLSKGLLDMDMTDLANSFKGGME